jgi:hypothetical protein
MKKASKNPKLIETRFSFKALLWKHEGPAGWCFVTIPKTTAKRIRAQHLSLEEGWGRLKTTARVGDTHWKTSIWFDTKASSYLLPIKTEIRKKEKLAIGESVSVELKFEVDRWMGKA